MPGVDRQRLEMLRPPDRPAGARSRETRQDVRIRSAAAPRGHRGGDTDALDWHSDPHLLAILARGVKRERAFFSILASFVAMHQSGLRNKSFPQSAMGLLHSR